MSFEGSKAKWIWINSSPAPEEYGYFRQELCFCGNEMQLTVAAETDCAVYLNQKRIDSCFFAGYTTEKYYNEIDLTLLCKNGENVLEFFVRYEGVNSACRIEDGAGLIFSLKECGREIAFSSAHTPSAPCEDFLSHNQRHITGQLGYASDMVVSDGGYKKRLSEGTETERTCTLLPRPVKRITEGRYVRGTLLSRSDGRIIYDLSREEVGYLYIRVRCRAKCKLKIAYGEHINDGCVRYLIGGRNFSLDFYCEKGEAYFEQPFIRLGARYLEIITDEGTSRDDFETTEIGIIETLYPLTERRHTLSGIEKEIYETSVRTLRLSVHSHYEDCPWREQALYVLDSRNQMLCGYTAFTDTSLQRANLVFMSKGKRKDDELLELTYPAVNTPAIPFFSLMYPVAVYEYVKHTGDVSIINEVSERIKGILGAFVSRISSSNGLVPNFQPPYWNFYEWSLGNDGHGELFNPDSREPRSDLILNCALVYSLESARELLRLSSTQKDDNFSCHFDLIPDLKRAIVREFYSAESGIFKASTNKSIPPSVLGNSFALLIGLGDERTLEAIKLSSTLTPATLSMMTFVYDAIIRAEGEDNAREYILSDIEKNYSYMLKNGATSFWETINGEKDFANAGSLCHGWSALPIIYYSLFKKECFDRDI